MFPKVGRSKVVRRGWHRPACRCSRTRCRSASKWPDSTSCAIWRSHWSNLYSSIQSKRFASSSCGSSTIAVWISLTLMSRLHLLEGSCRTQGYVARSNALSYCTYIWKEANCHRKPLPLSQNCGKIEACVLSPSRHGPGPCPWSHRLSSPRGRRRRRGTFELKSGLRAQSSAAGHRLPWSM